MEDSFPLIQSELLPLETKMSEIEDIVIESWHSIVKLLKTHVLISRVVGSYPSNHSYVANWNEFEIAFKDDKKHQYLCNRIPGNVQKALVSSYVMFNRSGVIVASHSTSPSSSSSSGTSSSQPTSTGSSVDMTDLLKKRYPKQILETPEGTPQVIINSSSRPMDQVIEGASGGVDINEDLVSGASEINASGVSESDDVLSGVSEINSVLASGATPPVFKPGKKVSHLC